MSPSEIHAKLSAPFSPDEEKQRKGPGGKMLSYIDARAVMNRLDDVLGTEHWQSKMVGVNGNVACELTILFGGMWITKTDGAGETDIEGEKGSFSDAFKRAAVHFGVGRYLYAGTPTKRSAAPPLSTYGLSNVDGEPHPIFDEAEMQFRKVLNLLEDDKIDLLAAQRERDDIIGPLDPEERERFWFDRFKSGERTLLKKLGMDW